jgi:hypothetical protein
MFPIIPAGSATGASKNDNGIFLFGSTGAGAFTGVSNIVSNTGVVASDVAAVASGKIYTGATEYGGDKGISAFGYYEDGGPVYINTQNLISNVGVVASDTAGVGTARSKLGSCRYGTDTAIFAFGHTGSVVVSTSNLVSNVGVIASDTAGVGTARHAVMGAEFGTDQGIMAFGNTGSFVTIRNLVSNVGVVASDAAGAGTARGWSWACDYGEDTAIFAFGFNDSWVGLGMSNLVSNTGVVASDTAAVGTGRGGSGACEYGQDKGIFGFGNTGGAGWNSSDITNLVSNTGVIASDVSGVGTSRYYIAGCSFN